jgi:hypothetical protein
LQAHSHARIVCLSWSIIIIIRTQQAGEIQHAHVDSKQSQSQSEINRDLGLFEKFDIGKPAFSYETLQFDLNFQVSNAMSDTMVAYSVFDGHLCKEGSNDITNNTGAYLASRIRPDLQEVGNGDGFRTFLVTLNIEPENVRESPLYEDFVEYANVYFCVRLSVYNSDPLDLPSGMEALEVNFLEYVLIDCLQAFL